MRHAATIINFTKQKTQKSTIYNPAGPQWILSKIKARNYIISLVKTKEIFPDYLE